MSASSVAHHRSDSRSHGIGPLVCAGAVGLVAGLLAPLVRRRLGRRQSPCIAPIDTAPAAAAPPSAPSLLSPPPAAEASSDCQLSMTWGPAPHPHWRAPEKQPPLYAFPPLRGRGGANGADGGVAEMGEGRKEGGNGGAEDPAISPKTSVTVKDGVVTVVPEACAPSELYPLVISTVVPRPIAFISTVSKSGAGNVSPYSYFNAVAHNPPLLAVGHCWSGGKPKDSLRNILETGELVVSLISDWFVEAANHTCGPYPPDVNEMQLAGLTPLPSHKVTPPRIGESAVNMECRLRHSYDVKDRDGNTTTTVVLAEVVMFHFAEAVVTRTPNTGKLIVDPAKLRPMARLGGNTYGFIGHLFDIARPDKDGRYPGQDGFVRSERDRIIGK